HGITAAQAAARWPNLTLKKIPKMVLARCEWGHDDYSLNVANLPLAAPAAAATPAAPVAVADAAVEKKGARRDRHTVDLFGDSTGADGTGP
ncbi:MAG TPA: site-specific DNA-methyltransferase, partial [Burkholderiaceae bacterium]|nr:site-specific DNA-methyltransferase [Burkholderiaceae bacterium]